MEANTILERLFFINNELRIEDADQFFDQIGFHNTTREDAILSYVSNESSDLNGVSWCTIYIADGEIANSNFKTTKEINLESILRYAEIQYGFLFDEEIDNIKIYKKDKLRFHVRTIMYPTSQFSRVMYVFYLFEHSENRMEVVTMPP